MANHQGVKLCKEKVNILKTERQMYGSHEPYLQIFTHTCNLALSGSSRLLSQYPLPLLQLRMCSAVQLALLLWPQELDKSRWLWRRHRLLYSSESQLVERVETLNSFFFSRKDCKEIFHWPYFCAIFLFFVKALHLGNLLACKNSRPSSLPARVAFCGLGAKDGCFRRLGIF